MKTNFEDLEKMENLDLVFLLIRYVKKNTLIENQFCSILPEPFSTQDQIKRMEKLKKEHSEISERVTKRIIDEILSRMDPNDTSQFQGKVCEICSAPATKYIFDNESNQIFTCNDENHQDQLREKYKEQNEEEER